jgi:two-component system nitrogen regulation response regulator GlnG
VDRVLIVDSSEQRRASTEELLLDEGLRVGLAATEHDAIDELTAARHAVSLVVLRAPGPGDRALETLAALHAAEPKVPIVVVTARGSTDDAIRAMAAGAFDFLQEPFSAAEMIQVVRQGVEAGRAAFSPVLLDDEADRFPTGDALIGHSKPMQDVYKAIGRVAGTDATVLVRGESGTGKELVARAVYQHSTRADRPFVIVNCVAIPETLLESELFGHERGAFTGAVSRRLGKIEQANHGTVFLDEIGDMPLPIQAKVLRLLEDRRIDRLGGQRPMPVDVRIIAATNRDLEDAIADGRFRADLYYRLNVVPIGLPPLRDRPEDIPALCDHFMERLTANLGVRNPGLTPEACRLLASHDWPGNVRELANALEKLLIVCRGRRIGAEQVSELVLAASGEPGRGIADAEEALRRWVHQSVAFGRQNLLNTAVDYVTRQTLAEVLALTDGNRTRAARLLGISRPTLLAKMSKHGLR